MTNTSNNLSNPNQSMMPMFNPYTGMDPLFMGMGGMGGMGGMPLNPGKNKQK